MLHYTVINRYCPTHVETPIFIIIILFAQKQAVQYANQVQQFNKNNEQDTPGSYKRLW